MKQIMRELQEESLKYFQTTPTQPKKLRMKMKKDRFPSKLQAEENRGN